MKAWEQHYNSRRGQTAVIFGKGPSLDAWIECGSPKLGHFKIGINHTGIITECEYNVSRHYTQDFSRAIGEWFMPLIHNWEYAPSYSKCSFVRPIFDHHWFIPVDPSFFNPTKEDIRSLKTIYTDGGSANCAIEIAYYLGASKVVFVGVDGGCGYAKAASGFNGMMSSEYDSLKEKTIHAAERRFGKNYEFWKSPLAKKETGQ
jgi:hypothetical protein